LKKIAKKFGKFKKTISNFFWEQIIHNDILGFLIALYFGLNKRQPTAFKENIRPNWNKKLSSGYKNIPLFSPFQTNQITNRIGKLFFRFGLFL
jgi:hypothetical protein